jgi:hypothetical protein
MPYQPAIHAGDGGGVNLLRGDTVIGAVFQRVWGVQPRRTGGAGARGHIASRRQGGRLRADNYLFTLVYSSSWHIDEPGGATVCIKWPCCGWQEFGRTLFRRYFVQGDFGCTCRHLGSGLSTLRRCIGINCGPTLITIGHRGSVRTTL